MKRNITLIKCQCGSIIIHCNAITYAITQCIESLINKKPPIYCAFGHPLCALKVKRRRKTKIEKTIKKQEKKERSKVNLTLSHVNHTF
jgi:hypothetical protein